MKKEKRQREREKQFQTPQRSSQYLQQSVCTLEIMQPATAPATFYQVLFYFPGIAAVPRNHTAPLVYFVNY